MAAREPGHFRLRYDRVDNQGRVGLRRAGRSHHLAMGNQCRGRRVLTAIDDHTVTVVDLETGEVIATDDIDPDRSY
ncbi:hypothetical protein [Agrococcus sp. UYP10]|uniref:hypothetical protein n=1 Tax=Agrococcus sp. UYP10 TaxID=1756355 RepID=UPI00339867B1